MAADAAPCGAAAPRPGGRVAAAAAPCGLRPAHGERAAGSLPPLRAAGPSGGSRRLAAVLRPGGCCGMRRGRAVAAYRRSAAARPAPFAGFRLRLSARRARGPRGSHRLRRKAARRPVGRLPGSPPRCVSGVALRWLRASVGCPCPAPRSPVPPRDPPAGLRAAPPPARRGLFGAGRTRPALWWRSRPAALRVRWPLRSRRALPCGGSPQPPPVPRPSGAGGSAERYPALRRDVG